MRRPALLIALSLIATPVLADDPLVGKSLVTNQYGQPICTERDELQEYFMAMLKKDNQWASQLKSCGMLKAGLKVAVIEDYSSDSDIGHVVKVRVFGPWVAAEQRVSFSCRREVRDRAAAGVRRGRRYRAG